jgi:virginiamycin B lyase
MVGFGLLPAAALAATSRRITLYPAHDAPSGIVDGPQQSLWYTGSESIGQVTTDGHVSTLRIGRGRVGIGSAEGITVGPDGALWFADSSTPGVDRLTVGGAVTRYAIPDARLPDGIARVVRALRRADGQRPGA